MTIQQHVKENTFVINHIIAEYLNSSDKNKVEGKQWYFTAHKIASTLSESFSVSLPKTCGVIAALSPNNHWDKNIIDAESLLAAFNCDMPEDEIFDTVKVSTFHPNKIKALNVLFNDCRNDLLPKLPIVDIIKPKKDSGHKVKSFYSCIINPHDTHEICVDGHALSIYLGDRITVNDSKSNMTPKQYAHIQQAYRLATDKINEIEGRTFIPMEIQAITWLAYRERHNL